MEETEVKIDKRSKAYKEAQKATGVMTAPIVAIPQEVQYIQAMQAPRIQELSPDEHFDKRFALGFEISRCVIKKGFEVPLGGVETSLYKAKGINMKFIPCDGVYCKFKARKFYIGLGNIDGWWL